MELNLENEEKIENCEINIDIKSEVLNYFCAVEHHFDGVMRAKDGVKAQNQFIKYIRIINNSEETVPSLMMRLSFNSKMIKDVDITLPPIEKGEYDVKIPYLTIDYELINALDSSAPLELKIELIDNQNENLIASKNHNFMVYPLSQSSDLFFKDQKLYSKYVTPNAPFVKQITQKAVLYNNGKSIISYQNEQNYNAILNELNALYTAIHNENIVYQNPPASDQIFQRVRLAEDIFKERKATCLDSSLLFCSCLEELGYNSLLILIPGHAFVGVFLEENVSNELSLSYLDIQPLISKGNQEIIFIETTTCEALSNISFHDATQIALEKVNQYTNDQLEAINITSCHKSYYSPVPTSGFDIDLSNLVKAKEIDNHSVFKIKNKDIEDVTKKEEINRFKVWEKKLLDLKESNRLISLKPSFTNSCRIILDDIKKIENNEKLKLKKLTLQFKNNSSDKEELKFFIFESDDQIKNILISNNFAEFVNNNSDEIGLISTQNNLEKIIKQNQNSIEETGAPTLYLSLGLLNIDLNLIQSTKKKKYKACAPFMLLPCEIKKVSNGDFYIEFDTDNLKINESVFEYIRQFNASFDFTSLYDFSDISKYYDACVSFKNMCAKYNCNIVLNESNYLLTNLSFSHQVMYLDMLNRQNELIENPIVKSIVSGNISFEEELISDNNSVETLENYKDFVAPLPYDSSQLKAILDCADNKSFILDGPPGTGKSQTIVNMITNAFYNHKTVLFVAEKKTALDVVYKRMEDLKLDRFSLELHSNKANKTDFLNKISASLDNGPTKDVANFEKDCEKLNKAKQDILDEINGMHVSKQYYYSLYDCIINTKEYVKYKDNHINFDASFLKNLDEFNFNKILELIENYQTNINDIISFETTPLRYFGLQQTNLFKDKDFTLRELNNLKNEVSIFSNSITNLFIKFPIKLKVNIENAKKIIEFFTIAYDKELYLNDLYLLENKREDIEKEFTYLSDFIKYKEDLTLTYDISSLEKMDLTSLSNSLKEASGLFKKSKQNKVIKEIAPFVKFELKIANCGKVFSDMFDYIESLKNLDIKLVSLKGLTGLNLLDLIDSYSEIVKRYKDTLDALDLVNSIENNSLDLIKYLVSINQTKDSSGKLEFDLVRNSFLKFSDSLKLIKDKYEINEYALNKCPNYFVSLKEILDYASREENFSSLAQLSNINKLRNGFKEYGILPLLDKVASGEIAVDEISDLFVASLSFGIMDLYTELETVNSFNSSKLNKKINDYKDLIDEVRNLSISKLSYNLSKDFLSSNVVTQKSGKIGGLKKACSSSKGVTIREILSSYSDTIMHYLPCFLMSPLSAAQYLSASSNFPKFDIVIFDEASQIPVHEAIGPIARGKSLIVAGDPKQMPPSPYSKQEIEDETLTVEDKTKYSDCESLLDECLHILPRHRLTYHYRSKNESLIQFSNSNFYNNELNTFPSSQIDASCVEFVYVKTNEVKQNSNITSEELNAITNKVKEIYTSEKTKNLTLGVISFNLGQADRIESAINKMFDENLNVKEAYLNASKKEDMFVKNIENVQGDERDIIIMCVGFGLNKQGYARLGGPLIAGDNNGSRRLNVCASRAKEKMILISTLTSKHFKEDSKILNNGEKCLKHFISYCEEASSLKENTHAVGTNNIIYYIQNDLSRLGYQSDSLVGNSEYRVDLAVKIKGENNYKLGLIIDTKPISINTTCRDKYYLHPTVLNQMKWNIIYVYALEYYLRPEQTINKIVDAINESNSIDYLERKLSINIEKDIDFNPYDTQEFKIPELKPLKFDKINGFDFDLIIDCEKLIDQLSPLSFDLMKKIIFEKALSLTMTKEMEKDFKKKVDMNLSFKAQRDPNAGKDFFYKDFNVLTKFYVGIERDIRDISKEEICNAFAQINKINEGLTEQDLFKETLHVLNCEQKSLIKTVKERLNYVYNIYKEKGRI